MKSYFCSPRTNPNLKLISSALSQLQSIRLLPFITQPQVISLFSVSDLCDVTTECRGQPAERSSSSTGECVAWGDCEWRWVVENGRCEADATTQDDDPHKKRHFRCKKKTIKMNTSRLIVMWRQHKWRTIRHSIRNNAASINQSFDWLIRRNKCCFMTCCVPVTCVTCYWSGLR